MLTPTGAILPPTLVGIHPYQCTLVPSSGIYTIGKGTSYALGNGGTTDRNSVGTITTAATSIKRIVGTKQSTYAIINGGTSLLA
jgi:hypothetical protein